MASSLNIVFFNFIFNFKNSLRYILCCFVIRRKQSETERNGSKRTPVELDELKNDSPDLTASTSNLVYQNVAQLQQPAKGKIISCIEIRIKLFSLHICMNTH